MAERPSAETAFERLEPDQVAGQSFAVARKGFDQQQVQAFLVSVGNQIKGGQQQIRDLREQVVQVDAPLEPEVKFSSQGVKLLDSDVEATRRQTQTEAGEMANRARRLAEELQTTVEGLRSQQVFSGGEEVAELLEQSYEQAQAVAGLLQEARDQAEAEVNQGRDKGREIVEQAKALRLGVLRDMARRRQAARAQVERLRAGRDKLMAALGEVRNSIDQSLESAKLSLTEAKIMADAAARRVEDQAEPTDLALLSELDDAQVVGMVPQVGSVPEARAQPESAATNDAPPSPGAEPASCAEPALCAEPAPDTREIQDGVALLSPVEHDPVVTAADHPALAGADDSCDVDAIFARLRTQSDREQKTSQNAVEAPAGRD